MTRSNSPCVKICSYTELKELLVCIGCGRTYDEITEWFGADNQRKEQINIESEKRRLLLTSNT